MKRAFLMMVLLVVAVGFVCPAPVAAYNYGDFRSETLVTKAWGALNDGDLEAVLAYTNKCIELYADQARTIRIPVHMVETINKFVQIIRRLVQNLGSEPLPEAIAMEMGIDVNKVRHIMKVSQDTVSLETSIGDSNEESTLKDFIEDTEAVLPSQAAARRLLKEYISEVIVELSPREQKILRMRFGLEDGRARTLEEVGKEFNVTRERIRQIEAKALRKLRHPSRSRKLKDYLE